MHRLLYLALSSLTALTSAALTATENSSQISLKNDRLFFTVSKSTGAVNTLSLDGQNLLGSGRGPYLDCNCIGGFWTPGSSGATYKLVQGNDSTGTSYGGAIMSHNYQNTGKTLEQYFFLRDGETGMHMFSRVKYSNSTTPNGGGLGELRTLFRPDREIWTHLSSSEEMYATLPPSGGETVQDATSYVGSNKSAPYVQEMSDYFTKYMFSESWRHHSVHGVYADGSKTPDGSTYGSWLIMNTKDTYFNGPIHSDLTVDGIVYNYLISNHHGNGIPRMLDGFDRTFGPAFYYFNKGTKSSSLQDLRNDALQYADPAWNAAFYDSIAPHVPNYVLSSDRGTFQGQITLPAGASRAIAVLSINGRDFQDNNVVPTSYQYWADIDETGAVTIPRVKEGTYRLTVYADGIFGQYTQDDVQIEAGATQTTKAVWAEESAGLEVWRIGTPDKSCGEYRHGSERDLSRTRRPEQYRLYWAVHDFPTDFPDGVDFKIGRDDIGQGLNYIHWSVFGGKGNSLRPEPYYENVNNWTLRFDLAADQLENSQEATFTIQLAGVKTSAGSLDSTSKPWGDLPYTVAVNDHELDQWLIPANQSSSCGARSAAQCYTTGHKWTFLTSQLLVGENRIVLSLPYNATAEESAVLPETTYLQYDALRLEV